MVRVLQITDTHLDVGRDPSTPPETLADAVYGFTGRTTDELASQVVEWATEAFKVDLLLHTGDLVDTPWTEAYEAAAKWLEGFGLPVAVTAGNHDEPEQLAAAFGLSPTGCDVLDVGGWRVVTASSADPGNDGGAVKASVLDQLERALRTDRPTLVGTHHPPLSPCDHPDCTLANGTEVLAAIAASPSVMAVAAGHLHLQSETSVGGRQLLITPSTCLQLTHTHPLRDHNTVATPIGARLIELRDDATIDTSVIWAPHP